MGTTSGAKTLIDTGAQVSVIPRYIYDGFPEKTKPLIQPCKLKIRAGNGTNIKLFGVATIEFKIDDMTFTYDMHIVDNTIGPFLGYDFLHDIGKVKNIKHHIDTGNEDPVVQKPRRQAKAHTEEIKKQVEKLYRAGIIRPSESDWASNVVMAKKGRQLAHVY